MEGAGDSRHRQPRLEEDGESYAQGQGFGIRWSRLASQGVPLTLIPRKTHKLSVSRTSLLKGPSLSHKVMGTIQNVVPATVEAEVII